MQGSSMFRYNLVKVLRSPRVWIALCLAATVGMGISYDYYKFCIQLEMPANIFEGFLIGAGYRLFIIFHPLNLCFILCESPFLDENAAYIAFRSGRKVWNRQVILLITTISILYYLFILICGVAVMIPLSYLNNSWSQPLQLLSDDTLNYTLNNGLAFSSQVMNRYNPLPAVIVQIFLLCLYSTSIVLLYNALSMRLSRLYAFLGPVFLHAIMLMVHLDGFYAKYSLFSYLTLSGWGATNGQMKGFFIVACILIIMLSLFMSSRSMKKIDINNLSSVWFH